MNEDQATALFAPARERPVPPAAFAMADVFAEAALQQRRRLLAAGLTSIAAMLIVVIGVALLATSGSHHSAPANRPADLLSLVRAVPLPADAQTLPTNPLPDDSTTQQPGYVAQQRFWTTSESPQLAVATMAAHQPAGLTAGSRGFGTTQGLNSAEAYFDGAETATIDGPHLSLVAQTLADGRTALVVRAWQITKPAKTADETVTRADSVTVSGVFGSATVTGADAHRLAADVNALWVTVAPQSHECSGSAMTLAFASASSKQVFTLSCGRVLPEPATNQPQLLASSALANDLGRVFPSLSPVPIASTAPTQPLSDLGTVLDQLPAPPGSTSSATPPVTALQTVVGLATGADVRSQARYWTSPMSRDAAVTWLSQHLPSRWNGNFSLTSGDQRVGVYSGPANPREYGPNLEITVVSTPTGSAYRVDASEQPLETKSAAEHLTGVTGVTLFSRDEVAPQDQPPLQSVHLIGAQAQGLAADVNALVVPPLNRHSCTAGAPDVLLDFTTSSGHTKLLYDQNCHNVTLLTGSGPDLDSSGPLYDDVGNALKSGPGPTRGTLIVAIITPTGQGLPVAGTITVTQGGVVTRKQVTAGQAMIVTEPVGAYTITAITGTATCTPGTAVVRPGAQTDLQIACH